MPGETARPPKKQQRGILAAASVSQQGSREGLEAMGSPAATVKMKGALQCLRMFGPRSSCEPNHRRKQEETPSRRSTEPLLMRISGGVGLLFVGRTSDVVQERMD